MRKARVDHWGYVLRCKPGSAHQALVSFFPLENVLLAVNIGVWCKIHHINIVTAALVKKIMFVG